MGKAKEDHRFCELGAILGFHESVCDPADEVDKYRSLDDDDTNAVQIPVSAFADYPVFTYGLP